MILQFFSKRPWIFVFGAFTGFVLWWVFFITLAMKHVPPEVPLVTRSPVSHASH